MEINRPHALSDDDVSAYEGAKLAPFFFEYEQPGFLTLAGEDRLDYLQRQTTNNLELLAPGGWLKTVLTNPAARILDVLSVFEIPRGGGIDPLIGMITLPGRGGHTLEYFRRRIFFMDKVTLEDESAAVKQVIVSGPKAEEILPAIGLEAPRESGNFTQTDLDQSQIWAFSHGSLVGNSYLILSLGEHAGRMIDHLTESGVPVLGRPAYELLRLEAGVPGPDAELTDRYTPLELGLDSAISSEKGCYTGQEVIARQITYDKVTQRLVGIQLSEQTVPGEAIFADGKKVGTVTSTGVSPKFGPLALGIIRRPHNEAGSLVQIGDQRPVEGRVTGLPFGSHESS
ncbi:MAG: glycine cleavage T C-terminal barrel domain-containing protein [Anaerolineales bacterium]|nr:glycine cleavage T C-terminal barrel domain-containing protein [Anaerolineales bacterium]